MQLNGLSRWTSLRIGRVVLSSREIVFLITFLFIAPLLSALYFYKIMEYIRNYYKWNNRPSCLLKPVHFVQPLYFALCHQSRTLFILFVPHCRSERYAWYLLHSSSGMSCLDAQIRNSWICHTSLEIAARSGETASCLVLIKWVNIVISQEGWSMQSINSLHRYTNNTEYVITRLFKLIALESSVINQY